MVNTAWESIVFSRAPSPSASYVLLGSGVNSSHKFFISFSQKTKKNKAKTTSHCCYNLFYTRDPLLFFPPPPPSRKICEPLAGVRQIWAEKPHQLHSGTALSCEGQLTLGGGGGGGVQCFSGSQCIPDTRAV